MTQEVKALVKRILSSHKEFDKIYPSFFEYVDSDFDYYQKSLSESSIEFRKRGPEEQASMIAFCFKSGLKTAKSFIKITSRLV